MKTKLLLLLLLCAFSKNYAQCVNPVSSFSENFDNYDPVNPPSQPDCWSGWGGIVFGPTNTDGYQSSHGYYNFNSSDGTARYLVFPRVDNAYGTLQLRVENPNSGSTNAYLEAGVVSSQANTASFTAVGSPILIQQSANYNLITIDFSTYPGNDEYIAIRMYNTGGMATVFWLDNISYVANTNAGNIVYVANDATGNNDGTSWTDAYTNIETAVQNANFTLNDEVWVKQGVYTPSGSGRDATYLLPNKAKLYGGFNGTETLRTQRDYRTNVTTLSGDLNGDDNTVLLDTETTRQDNAYHVISLKGTLSEVIVDGFTISDGNANGGLSNNSSTPASDQFETRRAGAVYSQPYGGDIDATIINCVLEKHTSSHSAVFTVFFPIGQSGNTSDIDFKSCIIRDNYSNAQSAFHFRGTQGSVAGSNIVAKGTIENCLFTNNVSANYSSCITFYATTYPMGPSSNVHGVDVDLVNNTFNSNTGVNGNVITMYRAGNTKIINTIVYGNGSQTPIRALGGSRSVVQNSIFEGGQYGISGSDPLFVDANNNNFQLSTGSPAIDAGNNTYSSLNEDLLGNQRIFNTTVDMGAYEFGSVPLGVNDFKLNETKIKLYPNPTASVINIKMKTDLKQATIFTVLGAKVLHTTSKTINTTQLKSGVYLIKIENESGNVVTKRFIKQ